LTRFPPCEVWGIRRQIALGGVNGFYRRLYALDLVCRDIVHDDDVAAFREDQTLFDIGVKSFAVHRPLDQHWRGHTLASQTRDISLSLQRKPTRPISQRT
jgi:hypothetical protein